MDKLNSILISHPPSLDVIAPAEKYVSVGNLSPGGVAFLQEVIVPEVQNIRWNIFISARNGLFIQKLRRMRLDKDRWTQAMRVNRDAPPNDILLKEEIDSDYPRDGNGEVEWVAAKG